MELPLEYDEDPTAPPATDPIEGGTEQEQVQDPGAVLGARLIDLRDHNVAKLRELAGFRRRPHPELVASMRLDALLDLVLGDLDRIRFELLFEQRIAELLDNALAEARRSELLDGVGQPMPQMPGVQDNGRPPGSGLIVPG